MVFSKYNYLFESKYGYLLYNASSNAFIKLDKESFDKLKEIETNPDLISELSDSTRQKLIDAKVFVNNDDQFFYNKRINFYFNSFDSSNLGLALAPTTHCNFYCSYCYEESKKAYYMNEEVEQKVLEFIAGHNRVSKLNLTWYGGEPLLGFESIKRLLRGIEKIPHMTLADHAMTTNGYLLTKEKSLFFKDYPMDSVQITLDGNREAHDKRRTLAPHKGPTFDVIVENIDEFIIDNPNTKVVIRANLDHTNSDTFIQVYTELSERWKGKNVMVYPAFVTDFSSVMGNKSREDNFAINGCRDECFTSSEKMAFFEGLHQRYGINVNFAPKYVVGGCGATVLNYYVIGPKGELYKCWNDIGDPNLVVGTVFDENITNYSLLARYLGGPTMMDDPKCLDCKLFPLCDGGCAWNRHKNIFENANMHLCSARLTNPERSFELYYEQLMRQSEAETV